jgi:predicted ester cyclase
LPEGIPSTHAGLKEIFGKLFQAFPDLYTVIEETIIEADKVVARQTWMGTHQADFFGNPPSGKQVSFGTIDIVTIKEGQIIEHWGESNWLRILQQIGASPK